MRHSNPDIHQGELVKNKNLFGAPCDVTPPFTWKELEKDYLGCQNLPATTWMNKYGAGNIYDFEARIFTPTQNQKLLKSNEDSQEES
jgi:hypothetical protein